MDNPLRDQYKNADNLSARGNIHARFSTNPYPWFRWVFDHFNLPPQSKILEIGCGPGWLWQQNLDRISRKWEIVLSDLSPGMLNTARENTLEKVGNTERLRIDLLNCNANTIPFETESFDAVIANHMLYHVRDRAEAIVDIYRVLKPHGKLFAATNGSDHLREINELRTRWLSSLSAESDAIFTAHEFTLQNGAGQLKPPFQSVEIHRYFDALEVTEAKPLAAYILSMNNSQLSAKDHTLALELELYLDNQIKNEGSLHIHKSTGLFIATKR